MTSPFLKVGFTPTNHAYSYRLSSKFVVNLLDGFRENGFMDDGGRRTHDWRQYHLHYHIIYHCSLMLYMYLSVFFAMYHRTSPNMHLLTLIVFDLQLETFQFERSSYNYIFGEDGVSFKILYFSHTMYRMDATRYDNTVAWPNILSSIRHAHSTFYDASMPDGTDVWSSPGHVSHIKDNRFISLHSSESETLRKEKQRKL